MAAGTRHPGWALAGLLVLLTIPLGVWAAGHRSDARQHIEILAPMVPQQTRPGYATSDRCEACHPSQYESWHRGYHRTMTQYASPASVRGNFEGVRLQGGGYDVTLSHREGAFFAEMVDPLWQYEVDFGQRDPNEPPPRVERRISLVTGSHHMQAYWVPSGIDNAQMSLPFTYLFDDQRWVPRGDVFLHPPDEHRHQVQVWNVSCIRCHATGGQPLTGSQPIQTRVAEMGIACEQCHGPAEKHIAANQSPFRRYLQHVRGGGDDTIVNPARLAANAGSQVCGQCHSLTEVAPDIELGEGKKYLPGDDLDATQPLLRPLHPTPALRKHIAEDALYLRNYFWADGTIRVSSRDYSGMIESKCTTGGKLGCMSCHSLHEADPDMLVAEGKDGDGACTTCHPAVTAAHAHHAPSSAGSRCVNCHMPHTVYGLLKGIRNHRIDSPVVTGKVGGDERPNACNLCHLDKSLAWTARHLATWFLQPVPAGLTDAPAAASWLLSGDAVLRALAAWHFGWAAARQASPAANATPYLVAALADPYAAVRYVAGHALANLDPANQFDYLAPPEQRKAQADAILGRWRGDAHATEIRELLQKRDDTPVQAME